MTDETQLGHELAQRAEDVPGGTLTFEDVRGRARQIRRRRATGVVAVVAAVVLILVPVSLFSGTAGGDGSPEPAPSPTQGIDPLGEGLPVLQDGVIIYPGDRSKVQLHLEDGMTPDGFAALGADRHVVTAQTDTGNRLVVVVDETGTATATYPLSGGLAAASGSSAVAWMDPDGTPMLITADAQEPLELTSVEGSDPTAVAVTGDCSTVCTVTVKVTGDAGLGPSWQVDTAGQVTKAPIPAVVDVSPAGGQIAGVDSFAPDDIHACGGVYNVGYSSFIWHNCEDNVFDFSPGGELVATTFAEGLGPNHVTLRDAHSGTVVGRLDDAGWIPSMAWEGEHLLAVVVAEDGATSLVQIGTSGNQTVQTGLTTDMEGLRPALILPTVG